jgi:hypothetical protein
MFFFGSSDCCGGTSQTGNATPLNPLPVEGSLICDDRYLTLPSVPRGKALVVASGSNCQTFLGGDTSGIVSYDAQTGEIVVAGLGGDNPEANGLTVELDPINPKVAGAFPTDGFDFKYLVGAGPLDGTVPSWFFAAAPTFHSWLLASIDGRWKLIDAGSIPGINQVGNLPAVDSGRLVVIYESGVDQGGQPAYTMRMLSVVNNRVLIGVISGGVSSYRQITDPETLEHTIIKATALLQARAFEELDLNGVPFNGGLPILVTTGIGAVSDSVIALYSPATKSFHRMPPPVREAVDYDVEVAVADDSQWHTMGGHCTITAAFQNPNFFVSACIRSQTKNPGNGDIEGDYNMQFGLFIDGVISFWWQIKGGKDNSLTRLVKGVAVGVSHTVDIRVNKDPVSLEHLVIKTSNMDVFSVM